MYTSSRVSCDGDKIMRRVMNTKLVKDNIIMGETNPERHGDLT